MSGRALLLLLGLLALTGCDTGEALQRMNHQAKVEAFGEEPQFKNGASMQSPPEGTVSRETDLGDPFLTDGAVNGVFADHIPVPVTRELFRRGRERFDIHCAACHGVRGDGRTVVAERMKLRAPPSILGVTDVPGRLYGVIAKGYGLMPSYAAQLPVDDRWAIVAYLRALQRSQSTALDDLPEAVRAEALAALKAQEGAK
jgi:mono/diheme cytochrome c family protein